MKKVRADQDYADLVEAYELNQNNLKKLYSVPDIPGPKFVYDHLLTLHAPYVYDEEGEFHYYPRTDPKALVIGYTNSIMYTNKRLLPILDNILAKSHTPPVILIFGDHGLALDDDRIYNLAAYHLPQDGSQLLYPTITPVNSFRVIFDRYFGAKLPLLKDISYFSLDAPFKFTQVDEYLRKDCLN